MSEGTAPDSENAVSEGGFNLEAPKPVSNRVRVAHYKKKLKEYEAVVGRSERVLKGWIARGRWADVEKKIPRDPPDLPPFDEPEKLADWWKRCMENKCPDVLTTLAQGGATPAATTSASSDKTDPSKVDAPPSPPASLAIPEFHEGGFSDADSDIGIQYIRGMVHDGIKEMKRAQELKDAPRYWNARKQWEKDVETLRKWEKDLVKIQEGKGDVVRTKVMNQVLVSIFGVMGQSFTNALFALARQLAPQLNNVQAREVVLPHRDHIIGHIKKTRFATAWGEAKLELLPPAA